MTNRKPVLRPEIDVGSELPLTSFNVTHPGLAELSKLICSDNRLCTPTSERHRLSNRVRDCLKPIIRMHPVAPIWMCVFFLGGGGGLSNCMRGFTLHQKLGFLFTCYPCMSLLLEKKKKHSKIHNKSTPLKVVFKQKGDLQSGVHSPSKHCLHAGLPPSYLCYSGSKCSLEYGQMSQFSVSVQQKQEGCNQPTDRDVTNQLAGV